MCCRLEGEVGRLQLETALKTLGEVASWKNVARQEYYRCCPHGPYKRTVVSWSARRRTVFCQGQCGKLLQQHLEQALVGRPPMEAAPSSPEDQQTKQQGHPGAITVGLSRALMAGGKRSGSVGKSCARRQEIDVALRQLGEEASWIELADTEHSTRPSSIHRCRQSGPYDKTMINWYSGTCRVVCQGLNSAALELHLERALRGTTMVAAKVPDRKPELDSAFQQVGATCGTSYFAIGTPTLSVVSESTPVSKACSVDGASTGSPSDDSPPAKGSHVRFLAQQFNERMKDSTVSFNQKTFPFPYPALGLAGQVLMTRSASCPASGLLVPSLGAITPQAPHRKSLPRSRSCAAKAEEEVACDRTVVAACGGG